MCWYAELTSIVEQNKDCCSKMQDNGVEYIEKMKICATLLFFSTKYVWHDFLMCLLVQSTSKHTSAPTVCRQTSCCPSAIFYLCVFLGDKCTKATAEKWPTHDPLTAEAKQASIVRFFLSFFSLLCVVVPKAKFTESGIL